MGIALALSLLSLHAFAAEQADYSQCSVRGMPGYFTGQIGADGYFQLDPAAAGNPSKVRSADGKTETLTVTFPGWNGGRPTKAKYVLSRKDGRPESMELRYDAKAFSSALPGMQPPKDPGVGSVTRFEYVNGHCFVKEVAAKLKSGKEIVSYDFETCNNVLAAAKKFGKQKLSECANMLGEVESAVKNAAAKIDGPKRQLQLSLGMGMFAGWEEKKPFASGAWAPISSVMSCAMARQSYGMEVDADVNFGGAFVGGFSGTAPSSSSPDTREGAPDSSAAH